MSNPLVDVGFLNRLVASVSWPNFPGLNVTASFLNREGIGIVLEGQATTFHPAMVAAVPSPEPYQLATITINLLKTQSLSAQYKAQYERSTLLGPCTIRPDVQGGGGITPYLFTNCGMEGIPRLMFSGEDAGWVITLKGTYNINSSLY